MINICIVLRCVGVDDSVALVVVALADEPGENPPRLSRIGDRAFRRFAIKSGDVITGNRAPVDLSCRIVEPAFNTGEQSLDARAVAVDCVTWCACLISKRTPIRLEN